MIKEKIICLLVLVFLTFKCYSQTSQTEVVTARYKVRNGIWLTPAYAKQINGIALGIIGPDAPCNLDRPQVSNGLNIQLIANSLFFGFMPVTVVNNARVNKYGQDSTLTAQYDSLMSKENIAFYRTTHNGLELAPFGTTTARVNGVSISSWAAMHTKFSGLAINLLWQYATTLNGVSVALINSNLNMKGIQIGLINKSVKLKGLQFGLWNVNKRRSLPILNWNFKE